MRLRYLTSVAGLFLLAGAMPAAAQSLTSRIDRVKDGDVRFTFTLKPDVCGQGRNVYRNGSNNQVSIDRDNGQRDVDYDVDCENGPGRVVISRRDGETADLRFYVGGRWHASSSATDLGAVSTRDAADYLTNLAQTNDGRPGKSAIFPSTLIDSATVWPALMKIARDEHRPRGTRNDAVFWLGQMAEAPATAGLKDLVGANDVDREVREQAVFALSQRREEGVPALISIVKTNPDPDIRKKALFWLAQSNDPRALDLIEELLTRK